MHEEIRQTHTTKQNKTKQNCYGKNGVGMKEDKNRRQWSKYRKAGASTERPEHHQLVPSQYKGGGPMVKGIQRAWFGGGGKRGSIFGFLP